ncbi:MAG TPA: flagellar hook capping FlgD N-terminal domain-containing protein [bacterium]|jgi:flagellar basal-body rod modification protein FlgD|nr:flagellar hook capping FlgD N-terminal domain-containing protein [bacterium]
MAASPTGALAALYNNASPSQLPSTTQSAGNLDNEFLNMLMTELQNQDPTNPVDSTTMLAQQAQFESLSQMQNLNTNLTALIDMQSVSQATSLINQTIVGTTSTGAAITGPVVGIQFNNGTAVLQVNAGGNSPTTTPVQLANVTEIY